MKNADLALYRAKAEGRAGFRFFEHQMSAQVHARHVLELELRAGLESGQFEVHYQPLVSTRDRTATAFEALVRWRHPERGLILPGEFIPVAEESRLIVQLGHWVLTTACHEAAGWDNRLAVSVNISAAQFAHGLVQSVKSALESSGLPSTRLELEITESVLMTDPVASNLVFNELRELGVRLALDDFGTGYSSLSYLRSFPFNKIKIDRSFVRELATNPGALAIVQTIVSLGASLGIPVCAEGIETEGQYEAARALGCSQVQGYLFGRPERAVDALLTLRNAQKRVA
jgi:EAL domain-containing protein (putative c-di-GMP-specific phosphodiesterase class I)